MELHPRAVVPAFVLSVIGGLLAAFRHLGGSVLASGLDVPVSAIGSVLAIVSFVALIVVPLLVVAAGYLDGRRTDLVRSKWSLVGLLVVVGFLGHLVGYVSGVAGLAAFQGPRPSGAFQLVLSGTVVCVAGAVSLALAGVAGAGLGYLGRDDVVDALDAR